jgi:16S rRNA G1207 methylase RsmC
LVIVAKSEREINEMMKNLEKYLRKKKLEVNVEKTVMVFNRRKRKNEENEWNWEGRKIEQLTSSKTWVTHSTKEPRLRHISER